MHDISGPTRTGLRDYIPELDGLRALAVLLVFLHHFWLGWAKIPVVSTLQKCGWTGVDLFFVLSGFLITGRLLAARDSAHYYRNFYLARSFRIFPAYYLFLGSLFVCILLWNPVSADWRHAGDLADIGWFAIYLGNIKVAAAASYPALLALTPVWSLQIEEQFYLFFPFVVKFFGRKTLAELLVGAVILSLILRTLTFWCFPHNPFLEYVLLPCRMDGLAYGAGIALWFDRVRGSLGKRIGPRVFTLLAILLFGITITFFRLLGYDLGSGAMVTFGFSLSALTYAVVVFWAIDLRNTAYTAWLNVKPLRFIGNLSYGLYLWQFPAYIILTHSPLRKHWSGKWAANDWVGFIANMILTLALALLSWYLVEKPALRLKASFLSTTREQSVVGARELAVSS